METTAQLARTMELFSTIITPTLTLMAVSMGIIFGWRFLRNYERNQAMAREEAMMTRVAMQSGNSHSAQTSITIAGDPSVAGGYDFIKVPDEFKPVFLDAMNGFCDYAKLKGYSVDLSTEASLPGKVGLRITIVDFGVTVSTAKVRKDVDEYLQRLKDGDDFHDVPMPENTAEHMLIVAALKSRFVMVKTQLEMHQIKNDFLVQMVTDLKNTGLSAVGYGNSPQQQILQLTVQNDGGKNMGDSYKATNSQNIAQGKGASAYTSDSNIQIGNNHSERNQRIEALKDFVKEIQAENLPKEIEGEVIRYIENARDELENESEPDPDAVGKWLDRANKTISTASAGAGLIEKFGELLTMFGLN